MITGNTTSLGRERPSSQEAPVGRSAAHVTAPQPAWQGARVSELPELLWSSNPAKLANNEHQPSPTTCDSPTQTATKCPILERTNPQNRD